MRRLSFINRNRTSAGKVITAALVGSVVGATVGLLMAPNSGRETLRRLRGEALGPDGAWERAKSARGNVESRARELAPDGRETLGQARGAVSRRGNVPSPTIEKVSP
jgi:gas vesicle protein